MTDLSKEQKAEIAKLATLADNSIDTSDIAEMDSWDSAVVGKFYRPVKKQVTMRLDADVIEWLKQKGKGYQTRANIILRDAMEHKNP
jgi:uncharacterized protein (DUF4415 family)